MTCPTCAIDAPAAFAKECENAEYTDFRRDPRSPWFFSSGEVFCSTECKNTWMRKDVPTITLLPSPGMYAYKKEPTTKRIS